MRETEAEIESAVIARRNVNKCKTIIIYKRSFHPPFSLSLSFFYDDDSAKSPLLLPLLSKLPLPVAPARASARTRREPRDAPAFCARTFCYVCCVRARAMWTECLGI